MAMATTTTMATTAMVAALLLVLLAVFVVVVARHRRHARVHGRFVGQVLRTMTVMLHANAESMCLRDMLRAVVRASVVHAVSVVPCSCFPACAWCAGCVFGIALHRVGRATGVVVTGVCVGVIFTREGHAFVHAMSVVPCLCFPACAWCVGCVFG